ncbi:MAG: response regulator [Planctomycetota bacterium]
MPRLDGEEVFIELRKLKRDVCVLLTSGFTEKEMVDRLRGTGIAGFLKKPATMQALLAKVAEVLKAAAGGVVSSPE